MLRRKAFAFLAGLLLLCGCAADPTSLIGGASSACGVATASVTGSTPDLTTDQTNVARKIISVAIALPIEPVLQERAALIGVVTSMTEATLSEPNYGDVMNGVPTSSRGPFQQQSPWGSLEKRLNATTSAGLFYNGGDIVPEISGDGHEKGLLDIPNWWTLTVPAAAQAVEQSQFADGSNYAENLAWGVKVVSDILGKPIDPAPITTLTSAATPSGSAVPVAANACAPGSVAAPANGLEMNLSQDPSSFGWKSGSAADIAPFSWQGHSFGGVARGTEPLWTGLLNDLVPQIPGGLNGYLGGYEDRQNVNNPSRKSFHSYGLAIDINYDKNPNGADPSTLSGQYVIPPEAARAAAAKWGMLWGGSFNGTPDAMHFELHLSPEQVASLTGNGIPSGR